MSESPDTEYTPTTAEVRGAWSAWYEPGDDRWAPERFDRWLGAHDREVAAKALEDAAAEWEAEEFYTDGAASYFRTRAACIREGNTK